ncbi:MAG: glycosyltransferase [Patescibacteria group bacterium]|nr:glycosyltransferase [Patescibacteria group bacterium]
MISIIIPTLNEEKYLPQILRDIKSQGFSDYEIIVSDGKSEDKTKEIALAEKCVFVDDENRSPARQRNQGAKIAKGDVLLFLDADTSLPDGFLPAVYNEFKSRDLSVAGFYLKFNSSSKIYLLFDFFYHKICWLGQYFFPASVGVGMLSLKVKHDQVGGFDESIFIGEDYDYINRLAKTGSYRMIISSFLYFSVRRLEKEGMVRVLWKWFKGGVYFLVRGPIRKKIVKYEFGQY